MAGWAIQATIILLDMHGSEMDLGIDLTEQSALINYGLRFVSSTGGQDFAAHLRKIKYKKKNETSENLQWLMKEECKQRVKGKACSSLKAVSKELTRERESYT